MFDGILTAKVISKDSNDNKKTTIEDSKQNTRDCRRN